MLLYFRFCCGRCGGSTDRIQEVGNNVEEIMLARSKMLVYCKTACIVLCCVGLGCVLCLMSCVLLRVARCALRVACCALGVACCVIRVGRWMLACFVLRCAALRCAALSCAALRCALLRCVVSLCVVMCCAALRCVALRRRGWLARFAVKALLFSVAARRARVSTAQSARWSARPACLAPRAWTTFPPGPAARPICLPPPPVGIYSPR